MVTTPWWYELKIWALQPSQLWLLSIFVWLISTTTLLDLFHPLIMLPLEYQRWNFQFTQSLKYFYQTYSYNFYWWYVECYNWKRCNNGGSSRWWQGSQCSCPLCSKTGFDWQLEDIFYKWEHWFNNVEKVTESKEAENLSGEIFCILN